MLCMASQYAHAAPPDGSALFGGSVSTSGTTITTTGIVTADTFGDTIVKVVNWFAWFVAIAAVTVSLYSGFLFITSRGSPRQAEVAGRTLVFLVVGASVAVLSFSVITITKGMLGGGSGGPAAAPLPTCPSATPFSGTNAVTGLPECCDMTGTTCASPTCGFPHVYESVTNTCVLP